MRYTNMHKLKTPTNSDKTYDLNQATTWESMTSVIFLRVVQKRNHPSNNGRYSLLAYSCYLQQWTIFFTRVFVLFTYYVRVP